MCVTIPASHSLCQDLPAYLFPSPFPLPQIFKSVLETLVPFTPKYFIIYFLKTSESTYLNLSWFWVCTGSVLYTG